MFQNGHDCLVCVTDGLYTLLGKYQFLVYLNDRTACEKKDLPTYRPYFIFLRYRRKMLKTHKSRGLCVQYSVNIVVLAIATVGHRWFPGAYTGNTALSVIAAHDDLYVTLHLTTAFLIYHGDAYSYFCLRSLQISKLHLNLQTIGHSS